MGREFELKYRADAEKIAAIAEKYEDFTTISMETTYYDTFDGKLGNRFWTLRRRMENEKSICTLKTPDEKGGRHEWEVEAKGIMFAIPMLCKQGAPMDLMVLTVNGVVAVCGARFTRQAKLLTLENCTVEIALDQGVLLGGGKEQPLCEVEVELKSGSEEEAVAFAAKLAKEFSLVPEKGSKFRRALLLAMS